jgi:hypothetical protein
MFFNSFLSVDFHPTYHSFTLEGFKYESVGAYLESVGKTVKARKEYDKSRPIFDEIFKKGQIIKSTDKCKFNLISRGDYVNTVSLDYSCGADNKDFSFPVGVDDVKHCELHIQFAKADMNEKLKEEFEEYLQNSFLDGRFVVATNPARYGKRTYEIGWQSCDVEIWVKPISFKLFAPPTDKS